MGHPIATQTVGKFDTEAGVVLGVEGEAYPRVHITPQGEVKTGLGVSAPAPLVGVGRAGIYLPDDWGKFWRPKLASAGSDGAQVALVGDSITRGYFSSALTSKGWAGLLRTRLQSAHGDGGGGFRGVVDTSLAAGAIVSYPAERVTLGSTWTLSTVLDGPGSTGVYSSTPGATASFPGVRGSVVRIFTLTATTGAPATYSIDGATPVAFTALGGASAIGVTTISGLSDTPHTVQIAHAGTTAQYLNVIGVEGSNPTGVLVNNYGRSGGQSNQVGAASGGYGSGGDWSGGSLNPADLVICAFGVNDAQAGLAPATYLSNLDTYLRRVRGAGPKRGQVDLLFLMQHVGTWGSTALYRDYCANVRALAETYGAAVVNMWAAGANSWDRWSDLGYWSSGTTPPLGSSGTNSVHPSDAGHQFIADTLAPIVMA